MSSPFSRPFASFCAVALLLGVLGVSNHELWTPDEPRVAAIGAEMHETGRWAVPRLGGEPFLEKPPLYWWSQQILFTAFGGPTATLARAPSAVFGILTLLLTWAIGRRFFRTEAVWLGGVALATCYLFIYNGHRAIVDMALVFGTTGALASYAWTLEATGARRAGLWAAFYASLGVAFFAKGVVGVGIPGLTVAVHALWTGRLRQVLGLHLLVGPVALLASAGGWLRHVFLDAGQRGVELFLLENQLGRFFTTSLAYDGGHERPFWYYLGEVPADFLPWTAPLLLAALALWRGRADLPERERDGVRLCVAATLPVLVALSFSGTKRGLYLLPIYPALALLTGWWMDARPRAGVWEERLAALWPWLVGAAAGLLCVGAVALDTSYWLRSLAGAALFAGALWAWRRHPVDVPREAWARLLLLVALGWAMGLWSGMPANERNKDERPLMQEVARLVPADQEIYLFEPTETTRAYVGFYTGRVPIVIPDTEALQRLLERRAPVWMIVEDRDKAGKGDLAHFDKLGIPWAEHARTTRPHVGRMMTLIVIGTGVAAAHGGPA